MADVTDHDLRHDRLLVSRVLESGRQEVTQPMYCQMNRLTDSRREVVWMQIARWIKFEEVLDEAANRWSKPHVPALSLEALGQLRREMKHAPLFLDLEVYDMMSLVGKLTSSWVHGGYLDNHLEDGVRSALLRPHRQAHERKMVRPSSTGSNLLAAQASGIGGSLVSLHSLDSHGSGLEASPGNSDDEGPPSNRGTPRINRKNTKLQRKVPKNSVSTNILVGELTCLRRPLVAFVRLQPCKLIGQLCEVSLPSRFLFVCLVPEVSTLDPREVGRCVGVMMADPIFRELADQASNRYEILAGMSEFTSTMTALPSCVWDAKSRLEPPVKIPSQDYRRAAHRVEQERKERVEEITHEEAEEEDGLKRTGRLFGGLVDDLKRKLPWYISDFRDSLHVQCVASTIFLFLATLTPNVTFGGLLGQGTDQYMGTMECILAASITGVVFALFSGQPLNILGSTGPMLVLEVILYRFCRDQGWDFLPFRVWIGLWTSLILILFVAFDLSSLVRFITRFTEECFACLIAIIFIYEAFAKTIKIDEDYPVHFGSRPDLPPCPETSLQLNNSIQPSNNQTNSSSLLGNASSGIAAAGGSSADAVNMSGCLPYAPDVFFLSVMEFVATFGIAFFLVQFKNSIFFPTVVRRMLSDFSVLIAILLVVGVDALMGVPTPKLDVPDKFSPTRADRDWLISPLSDKNPWWLCLAALVPALLATILVFMDQQITAVIVNRKEHKLKKGCGYHLDILVLSVLIIITSFLGLPWYVAATVSALAHVMSLKVESDCAAPGEKPEFLGVREQRGTGLLVGVLSGLSVLLTGVLRYIPLPVLYGVFLFMGIRALDGMQLVDRVLLYLVSPKYQPDYAYLRHVTLTRVHVYTLTQLLCLAGLWLVKSFKEISIGFPIMVLATCFVRKLLDFVFTQYELSWLDHLLPSATTVKDTSKQSDSAFPPTTNTNSKNHTEIPSINIQNAQDQNGDSVMETVIDGGTRTGSEAPISPISSIPPHSPVSPGGPVRLRIG